MNKQPAGSDQSIEQAFKIWALKHKIANPDAPNRPFNYRGAFLAGIAPDQHGVLPDVFRVGNTVLGFDASMMKSGVDPGLARPSNYEQMDTYYDEKSGINRPWGSVPGESRDDADKRNKEGRFDPALTNPANRGQMDTYYDEKAKIHRPWVDRPGQSVEKHLAKTPPGKKGCTCT
jgi:hypothetical protein